MRCTVVVEFDGEPGEPPRRVELLRLHRDDTNPSTGDIGLPLAEAQTAMSSLQQEFVVEQIGRFCSRRRNCGLCNTPRRLHDGRVRGSQPCLGLRTTYESGGRPARAAPMALDTCRP